MFKACVLNSGVSHLRIHSIGVTWAPRVVRSFGTTLHSSRGRQGKSRIPNPSEFETNELRKNRLRDPTLPNTQSIQREAHIETKVREDFWDWCWDGC